MENGGNLWGFQTWMFWGSAIETHTHAYIYIYVYMDVSENSGTPESSMDYIIGLPNINHPFWGSPIFLETPIYVHKLVIF